MSHEDLIREILAKNTITIDREHGNQLLIAVDGKWVDLLTYIKEIL